MLYLSENGEKGVVCQAMIQSTESAPRLWEKIAIDIVGEPAHHQPDVIDTFSL